MSFWNFGRRKSMPMDLSPSASLPTNIFLRAYKPAKDLTLADRTELIIRQQRFISDELKIWTWYMFDKTRIDIRDDACYDLIYKRAKKGMNTKRLSIIRYQPNDIPDLQSTCFFLLTKSFPPDPFLTMHQLGWHGKYSEYECINVDHFNNAPEFYNPSAIIGLMDRIIDEYKPALLYITSGHYHRNIAKLPEHTPWTGWITYLDNCITLPKSLPNFCEVQHKANGTLFKVCEEMFDDNNSKHTGTALKLEKWFKSNKVKV
jgi:hypothetical protein